MLLGVGWFLIVDCYLFFKQLTAFESAKLGVHRFVWHAVRCKHTSPQGQPSLATMLILTCPPSCPMRVGLCARTAASMAFGVAVFIQLTPYAFRASEFGEICYVHPYTQMFYLVQAPVAPVNYVTVTLNAVSS